MSATTASALAAGGCSPSPRAQFTLRLGANVPPAHPLYAHLVAAGDRIREASGGRVALSVFPSSQLGSDADMLSQVRSGAIDLMTLSGLILSVLVPVAAINGLGFIWQDRQQAFAAMDGNLGGLIRGEIARHGLVAYDRIFENGFRQVTTSVRPIVTPDDFHGLKIRVPLSALWTSMFNALGAAPTSINFNEVYSALQTRVVDGQENPLLVVDATKIYEVQRYCSLTNHMWDGFWLLGNPQRLARMPAALREIVAREFARAALDQRIAVAALDNVYRQRLAANLTFNATDPTVFRERLRERGFYAEWKARFGPEAWHALEQAVGPIA